MWNGIVPLFEKEYSILVPDLRGQGKSSKPPTGYHIDDMANDLYLLLEELEISKCHIVGSSMGAEVGLSLAATHPELVLSLVCEGALFNEFGEFGLFSGTEEEVELEKQNRSKQLAERILPIYPSKADYLTEIRESLEKDELWNDYFRTYFESYLEETDEGLFVSHYKNYVRTEYIQNYWDVRFEEYYKKISCPILFLPSEEESQNEKIMNSMKTFASFVKSYEIVHIKDSLHAFVWMQQPKVAGEVVKNFIKDLKEM
ncbi:alpha/beta fold hydrolase [Neobacillus sp. D3-1R]|uniref:alpha/beta fold hydrolase n=1 Tax=Neobacillus sp. D3-1R TaxID=3445778 RepID=UPI003F9F78D0